MQPKNSHSQTSSNLTLAESLDRLKAAVADVVCHPDLSASARDFLVSFCKVIADNAREKTGQDE